MAPPNSKLLLSLLVCVVGVVGYSETPRQYHIQTDEGPDRYFRFQTYNGQFRKEKRFEDGTVVGTYGWVDPLGLLRLYDYIADTLGYRIVRQRTMKVPPVVEPLPESPAQPFQRQPVRQTQTATQSQQVTSVVTQPQPITRPLPPTQLRPVSSRRPVSKPSQVAVANPVPQTNPFSNPAVAQQPHQLKPILIPLSQTGSLTPSVLEVQPATRRPQLVVRQPLPNVTPVPLIPVPNNNLVFGKDLESHVDGTSQQSFGDKTNAEEDHVAQPAKRGRGRGRGRIRGKPLALKRQSIAEVPNESSSSGNRGSVRFKGVPLSSVAREGTPKQLKPVPLNPIETPSSPDFDNAVSSTNFDSNNILRQPINTERDTQPRSTGAGNLTPKTGTNLPVNFDLPPDLPYSINYDLGNQFHFEKMLPDGTKVGRHGYVDPLGVLRVTHYSTGPNGHQEKQENKWVGTRDPEIPV